MFQARATQRVVKTGGRLLQVEITGAPHGTPVFLLHGTPGSRTGPKPRASVLYRLGVQLICYDRPGYGGSTRHETRSVADAAHDVEAIADDLRLDRFAVVGRSGGGPHALACSAVLPDRVARTAVLVSVAPADAAGLDWSGGMTEANVEDYSVADADALGLAARLSVRARRTARDPNSLLEELLAQVTDPDKRILDDYALRQLLVNTYAEAMRTGPYGWIDDVLALRAPWGFRLQSIDGPVRLWHGADDNFSPVGHSMWLAARIPHAEVDVQKDTAHFGAMQILPRMLPWLTGWDYDLVVARGLSRGAGR